MAKCLYWKQRKRAQSKCKVLNDLIVILSEVKNLLQVDKRSFTSFRMTYRVAFRMTLGRQFLRSIYVGCSLQDTPNTVHRFFTPHPPSAMVPLPLKGKAAVPYNIIRNRMQNHNGRNGVCPFCVHFSDVLGSVPFASILFYNEKNSSENFSEPYFLKVLNAY